MIRAEGRLIDDNGRTVILRGVNLGGSSKIPFDIGGLGNIHGQSLNNPAAVSFVGRPFPEEEAEAHFEKLKNWGFTFIRLIITWEALEHSGPGVYDEAYIAYLRKILLAAERKGISVYMDPHQDVWSRWTGGDGAPAWTLEKLGMDLDKLEVAGAAIYTKDSGKTMIWPVNYSLYAAATMFTVFFAGNAFAPDLMIDGQNAQDWLQERYLAAIRHCYRRLKNCGAVAGWGTMNEPHPGFIGCRDLNGLENAALATGPVPSPFQAMIAASGRPVEVPSYIPWLKGWKALGRKIINPDGISIFREGFGCPWKQAGVWTDEDGSPRLLKPDHFSRPVSGPNQGQPVHFSDDFLKPFMLRYIERMKEADRPILFFIEGIPHGENPAWGKEEEKNTVNAFHHYDQLTLFSKSFKPWFSVDTKKGKIILGKKKVRALYSAQLAENREWTRVHMGDMPCLLGEFGLPFDLDKKEAYTSGDYRKHEEALSLYYDAIDDNLLSSTIWNYSADNNHEDGDHWNGEDLSIVSMANISAGAAAIDTPGIPEGKSTMCEPRAMAGWLRPYPMATAGIPLKISWNRKKAVFRFRFRPDPALEAPTEIFIPSQWFRENPSITVKIITPGSGGGFRAVYKREEQRLFIHNDGYAGEAELIIS